MQEIRVKHAKLTAVQSQEAAKAAIYVLIR
jgi:hypothetical protein